LIAPAQGGAEGLTEMTFAVDDLKASRTLLERRCLPASPVAAHGSSASEALVARPDDLRAFSIALIARKPAAKAQEISPLLNAHAQSAVLALDHVVVRTPNPDRAIALFAGRLGLDLRLDRSNPDWGARLIFFRCGDLIIEAAHDLKAGVGDSADRLWGLSWRVGDIRQAHARLEAAGIEVSNVRRGRRRGSEVVTVRCPMLGVPTLLIASDSQAGGHSAQARP
jgi:catechol 2,3-dioxygenase-like lactoylglutathione lyase family enzyme